MVDLLVRARTNSRTHNIRVKADPGADANLMLIHHFREIFPYLCDSSGHPKEGVLEKVENSFESYSSDNVTVIGQTKIYAKNKQTQQFMTTRIFVIARERGPILLGNAPVVGRFMAAVTREETEGGEVEAYLLPKTGDGAEMTKSRPQSKKAITASKKKRIWTKKAKPVAPASEPLDITLELRPLTVSLSHLHLRELNQIAHKSKTWSFQEVYHMQNPVLSARVRENREQKMVLSGRQIALKYHEENTTG